VAPVIESKGLDPLMPVRSTTSSLIAVERSKMSSSIAARFSAAAICFIACACFGASAQVYPNKPLRLVVPFPPGGGNDILARTVGQRLTEVIGQQVVVENRGGAGGLIGAQTAATAAPDGYTLFLASVGNMAHIPAMEKNLPYDPVRDFAPVTLLATSSFVVGVNPSVPARSIKEFIALAKAKPGAMNYGSAGPGSSLHMTGEVFKYVTGVNLVHVPYRGTAPALTDLIGGQVQSIFSTMPPILPHVKSGKVRALGTSGPKRALSAPDIPTVAESGVPEFVVLNWQGIVVQRKVAAAIVQKLRQDLVKTMGLPGMSEQMIAQGLEAETDTPAQFAELIRTEMEKYRKVAVAAGMKID
jgi:tripartite-type tricarboxylate transporter receptor subunit TctC